MNAWWDRFHMQLEQCYRPQTHYTGSLLTREGIDFYNRKNHTFTRNKSTLLRLWIRRSTNKRIIQKEKLVYDWKDLLSGVGGTLSLLIGISFFSLCNQIIDAITYSFKMQRKNPNQRYMANNQVMDYSYDNLQMIAVNKGYNSISMRMKPLNPV